jgi:hypothetical protein
MKYIISPITTLNNESELYETKVGVEGKNMPLHYTVHGKTEKESRERAERLVSIMQEAEKHSPQNKFANLNEHY